MLRYAVLLASLAAASCVSGGGHTPEDATTAPDGASDAGSPATGDEGSVGNDSDEAGTSDHDADVPADADLSSADAHLSEDAADFDASAPLTDATVALPDASDVDGASVLDDAACGIDAADAAGDARAFDPLGVWEWQSPAPAGNDLQGAFALSASDAWAVGALGTTMHFDGHARISHTNVLPPPAWSPRGDVTRLLRTTRRSNSVRRQSASRSAARRPSTRSRHFVL